MRTLKEIISRYMKLLTFFSVTIILIVIIYLQISIEQKRAYDLAMRTFSQIQQVLEENGKELIEIRKKYRQSCLHNAELIARILENDPELMYDVEGLKELAETTEVDEIHIFDTTGRIFAGTHPEYYDYTFDSGEQMNFFKPMLEDKSLQLVQDITPNTAEGKLMQYSAVWSKNGSIIVQVGMEPVSVMKVTAKNELSYIFSLFCVSPDANYYALQADTGEIVGSTLPENVGKLPEEIGLDFNRVKNTETGFHTVLNGASSYCVFKKVGEQYLGRVVLSRELYQRIPITILQLTVCLIAVAMLLSYAATRYMDNYVVKRIQNVNQKLHSIAMGNLDETIQIQSSYEFSELSSYLNLMIKSLLNNNRKMSYVLSKTDLCIGVYEYNCHSGKVYFSEYVPKLLSLDTARMEELSSDYSRFKALLDTIRQNPVPDEPGVFQLPGTKEQYIRLEESSEQKELLGVMIDVTDEILRRRKIELERDLDPLTGLYNRRGLDNRLRVLFRKPQDLGCSGFVMIDADGLKEINDTYGHEKGDIYLKNISQLLFSFDPAHTLAARQSGDEFILFLYRYANCQELGQVIRTLEYLQDHSFAQLDDTTRVPLRFSFGCSLTEQRPHYQDLIKEADQKMYENKRKRKQASQKNPQE